MISYGFHTLFKCTFAGSVVYFFMIISKVLCNFCFIYYVRNLALVGKGTIRFIYTITFYCFCFLFRDYFFVMHINIFCVSTLHIKYFEHFEINSQRMDKFKFGYSINNVPITTERKYNSKVLEKIEALTKRMRWKAFSFEP